MTIEYRCVKSAKANVAKILAERENPQVKSIKQLCNVLFASIVACCTFKHQHSHSHELDPEIACGVVGGKQQQKFVLSLLTLLPGHTSLCKRAHLHVSRGKRLVPR